jgi:sn-glycerol 3-phosphate transport system ATP-binding protein
VTYVEELGASRLIHGSHGDVPIVAAVPANAPLGDTMSFDIRRDLLHFFDPKSGRRIL